MKKLLVFAVGIVLYSTTLTFAQGQVNERVGSTTPSWPLTVSVQFHSLSLPFRDLKAAFSNIGIGLGTEFNYNRRGNLFQTFQVGYYHNRYAGDGLFVSTQAGYRPHFGPVFAELKAGVGWNHTFHPATTVSLNEGQWQATGRTGKGLLMIPLGVSIGYAKPNAVIAPFVGYQFFMLSGYNPTVPLVPNQLLQAGARINFTH